MQRHALRSSRTERKVGETQNVFQMPSCESDRKLIILLSFSGGHNIICCPLKTPEPLQAMHVVHARRTQLACFSWKHIDKVELLDSDWMHGPRLPVLPGDHMYSMD